MSATPTKGLPLPLYKIQESYKDVQDLRGQKNIHKVGRLVLQTTSHQQQ